MEKTIDQIRDEIQKAIEELHLAEQYMNQALEPEFIDYAVYNLKAAQAHLDALILKYRMEEGETIDPPGIQTRFGVWATGLTNRVHRILSLSSA